MHTHTCTDIYIYTLCSFTNMYLLSICIYIYIFIIQIVDVNFDFVDFNETKKTFKCYLASVHCFVDDFEDEVRPYHVKHEEYS